MSANASAWALACKLFGQSAPTLMVALSGQEQAALTALFQSGLVKKGQANSQYVLCPYCQLLRGQVVRQGGDLCCHCPECGSVPLDPASLATWQIDTEKLIRQFRLALDIPPQQPQSVIADGVWNIGKYDKLPVILARSLDAILRHQPAIKRVAPRGFVVTPKPLRAQDGCLDDKMTWLPMDECFYFYGGQIRYAQPEAALPRDTDDPNKPVYGPFSEDFRWVQMESWPHGPIALSKAQGAIFKALWEFKGQPQSAERVMARAGYKSDKPADIFKVKPKNKGDLKYEGPYHAYNKLVQVDEREGLYSMECAST